MRNDRTREVLRLAQPRFALFAPGLFFGLLSSLSAIALLATSAWLITRASEHPPILFLNAAIVGVRAFALGRAAFRYTDRIVSHNAALRQLSGLRVGIYRRLIPLAPDGLGSTGRGDLLTRLVNDVDELQNLPLRVVQPLVIAGLTGLLSVIGAAILLPAAGLILAVALVCAFLLSALTQSVLAARAERAIAPLRGALTERLLEFVTNLDVFLAYGVLPERLEALEAADARLRSASLRRTMGAGASTAILSLLSSAAVVGALVVGVPALGGRLSGPALTVVALIPLGVFEAIASAPLALGVWREVRS
ncbi:MAG TPA: ABC transporter transmembrane domain-containing protein, partial [Lacisediminihabitans sp.]|uniref:ABC transporter transmembrane domain-containing protein n=1 Tax=Lacisediminihabitans sp. TaxID=2787631 RepID=UPI002EDB481C